MYVVDMCYKILDSCSRVRVSLTCMVSISSMMLGRLEANVARVLCNNVGMHGGGACGLYLQWYMCGQCNVQVWCESCYVVATFDELWVN